MSDYLYNLFRRGTSYLLFHGTVEARLGWVHPAFASGDLDIVNSIVADVVADILGVP